MPPLLPPAPPAELPPVPVVPPEPVVVPPPEPPEPAGPLPELPPDVVVPPEPGLEPPEPWVDASRVSEPPCDPALHPLKRNARPKPLMTNLIRWLEFILSPDGYASVLAESTDVLVRSCERWGAVAPMLPSFLAHG